MKPNVHGETLKVSTIGCLRRPGEKPRMKLSKYPTDKVRLLKL